MASSCTTKAAGVTVTVVDAVTVPAVFVAVKVYVVVALGLMLADVPVTVPIVGAMLNEVAPETVQLRVADWPEVTLDGVAVKLVMAGAVGTGAGTIGTGALPPPSPQEAKTITQVKPINRFSIIRVTSLHQYGIRISLKRANQTRLLLCQT
jgi:cytochrome c biogenesis factor